MQSRRIFGKIPLGAAVFFYSEIKWREIFRRSANVNSS